MQFAFGSCIFMGKSPKVRSNLGHGSLFIESSQLFLYFRLQVRYILKACVRDPLSVSVSLGVKAPSQNRTVQLH